MRLDPVALLLLLGSISTASALETRAWRGRSLLAREGTNSSNIPPSALDNECPMSRNLTQPTEQALQLCVMYSHSACCSVEEDRALLNDFETAYKELYGSKCPGCLRAYHDLMCGLYCSPQQAEFLLPTEYDSKGHMTKGAMKVYNKYCSRFWDACREQFNNEFEDRYAAFCKTTLMAVDNVTMVVSEDDEDVFMRWSSNHCDGTITGAPMNLDSDMSTFWIVFFIAVSLLTVLIIIAAVYYLSQRPHKYQPVEEEAPPPPDLPVYRLVGAGNSHANGNFFIAGRKNDADFFRNSTGVTLSRERLRGSNQTGWVVGYRGRALYGIRTDELAPPEGSGWYVYDRAPAPTVVALLGDFGEEEDEYDEEDAGL